MEEIAPGIRQLDTLLGGMEHMTAGFLVDGAQPALVETGSQSSVSSWAMILQTALGLIYPWVGYTCELPTRNP